MHVAEIYEPWVPRVGDRVRIRLSPECAVGREQLPRGHDPSIDGALGSVEAVIAVPHIAGHRFIVIFDFDPALPPEDRDPLGGGAYAAAELEPI
jgi:hypothetical protein